MHSTLTGLKRLKGACAGLVLLACALAVPGSGAGAGQERYEYDAIGRLVLHVDSQSEVTEYSYDPAGNLLSVRRAGQAADLAPALTSVSPSVIRRGETRSVTLTGQRLQAGTLQASDPGIGISGVQLGASQITAQVTVAPSVAVRAHTLTFSNARGAASVALVVASALPVLTVEPSPLALPPDNTARAITLRLSTADAVAHVVNIASSDAGRVSVNPASVTLAAGQTAVQVSVTPRAGGFANLLLTSPTLQSVTLPVFVTTDFRGANTSHAVPVGVQVGDAVAPSAPPVSATFASARVGVAVGPVLTGMMPGAVPVGGTYSLTVTGMALPGTVQLSLSPDQGVAVTQATVSGGAGAGQISAQLAVDAGAPPGERRVVVRDAAGQVIAFADPGQGRIVLTTGQPVIDSVAPLFAPQGATVRLTVRGRHLQGAGLRISPATDLRVDSAPVVNAAGTELTAGVQVAPPALTGTRRVQVITPSGQSPDEVGNGNQFTIVQAIQHEVSPIVAPLVGVVVGSSTPGGGTQTLGPVQAPAVGVLVGAAAQSLTPGVGVLGTSLTLVVQGTGLQSVQSVTLTPPDGITLGVPGVNAQGTQLSIPVSVDAAAPRTARRVRLSTATGLLPFTAPGADAFRVVAPAPDIVSVVPQVVLAGATTTLTVRGLNFSDVTAVRFEPAGGLLPVPPFAATDGNTVLRFVVQAAADAASGQRVLVVETAGGATSAAPSPANTCQVARQAGPVHDAIMALPVGVQVGDATPPPQPVAREAHAQAVGVVLESVGGGTSTRSDSAYAAPVGVLVGPGAARLSPQLPDGVLAGGSHALVIQGIGLDQVTAVTVHGTAGISLGTPVAGGEATLLTVPMDVPGTVSSGMYGLRLYSGTGTATARITDVRADALLFAVGKLPVAMESVSPIVLEQGKTYTFTVRGIGLRDVYAVESAPDGGLRVGPAQWSSDALGERLTVQILVAPDAAVGSRVIRLRVPGGITGADATPANTITISTPF